MPWLSAAAGERDVFRGWPPPAAIVGEEERMLDSKLQSAFDGVLAANGEKISDFVRKSGGVQALQVAQNDQAIIPVAKFLYTLVPAAVRFFVPEQKFVDFVLAHRTTLLRALPSTAPEGGLAAPA